MDAELEGYAWLPRMIDKARAAQAGTLGDMVHPCPIDKRCLERLEVDFESFTSIIESTGTDVEVIAGLRERGVAPPERQWFDAPAFEDELQRS